MRSKYGDAPREKPSAGRQCVSGDFQRFVCTSGTQKKFHLIRRKQFSQKIAFATFPCIGEGLCNPRCSRCGRSGFIRGGMSLPLVWEGSPHTRCSCFGRSGYVGQMPKPSPRRGRLVPYPLFSLQKRWVNDASMGRTAGQQFVAGQSAHKNRTGAMETIAPVRSNTNHLTRRRESLLLLENSVQFGLNLILIGFSGG